MSRGEISYAPSTMEGLGCLGRRVVIPHLLATSAIFSGPFFRPRSPAFIARSANTVLSDFQSASFLYLPRLRFVEADSDLVLFFLRDLPGIGIAALLQGCDEGERLERTARLTPALGDEVELGVLVPVADHGLYPAGPGLYGDEGEVVHVGEVSRGPVGDLVGGQSLL